MKPNNTRRRYSLLDRILSEADHALKTVGTQAHSERAPSPLKGHDTHAHEASKVANNKHTAGLMRINHTGEVCAQALYKGQALTAKLDDVREKMQEAADEETDHLAWCEQRLSELGSKPSALNPFFYTMSFSIGAIAGAAGDKWSLGFVNETEKQVCEHLKTHLAQLDTEDTRSREILTQMYIDEEKHALQAQEAGAAQLPRPLQKLMKLSSKVMTKSTYHI